MATDRAKFLGPVLESAAKYIELAEDESSVDLTDIALVESVNQALSQVENFVNRPLIEDDYDEFYPFIRGWFKPRALPLNSITQLDIIYYDETQQLTSGDDYTTFGDRVVIKATASVNSFTMGIDADLDAQQYQLRLQYNGGLTTPTDNRTLLDALALQTAANYRRRNTVGINEVRGSQGTTLQASSDAGGVIQAVSEMISPMVYYGVGQKWQGI